MRIRKESMRERGRDLCIRLIFKVILLLFVVLLLLLFLLFCCCSLSFSLFLSLLLLTFVSLSLSPSLSFCSSAACRHRSRTDSVHPPTQVAYIKAHLAGKVDQANLKILIERRLNTGVVNALSVDLFPHPPPHPAPCADASETRPLFSPLFCTAARGTCCCSARGR